MLLAAHAPCAVEIPMMTLSSAPCTVQGPFGRVDPGFQKVPGGRNTVPQFAAIAARMAVSSFVTPSDFAPNICTLHGRFAGTHPTVGTSIQSPRMLFVESLTGPHAPEAVGGGGKVEATIPVAVVPADSVLPVMVNPVPRAISCIDPAPLDPRPRSVEAEALTRVIAPVVLACMLVESAPTRLPNVITPPAEMFNRSAPAVASRMANLSSATPTAYGLISHDRPGAVVFVRRRLELPTLAPEICTFPRGAVIPIPTLPPGCII